LYTFISVSYNATQQSGYFSFAAQKITLKFEGMTDCLKM